ncbi:hypothetical protein CBS101457_006876 [Exobasidium rhododendri]|nr:hypothetical protein CBS101457_006876 [Exobasidium rhododendri]
MHIIRAGVFTTFAFSVFRVTVSCPIPTDAQLSEQDLHDTLPGQRYIEVSSATPLQRRWKAKVELATKALSLVSPKGKEDEEKRRRCKDESKGKSKDVETEKMTGARTEKTVVEKGPTIGSSPTIHREERLTTMARCPHVIV